MEEVYRERKVGYELGPSDEKEQEDDTVSKSAFRVSQHHQSRAWTYHIKLFSIHTSPSIHPTVTSPRKLRQLSRRSKLTSLPATRAVKRMRMAAHA